MRKTDSARFAGSPRRKELSTLPGVEISLWTIFTVGFLLLFGAYYAIDAIKSWEW